MLFKQHIPKLCELSHYHSIVIFTNIFIFSIFSFPSFSHACDCENLSLLEKWDMSKNVFLVELKSISLIRNDYGNRYSEFINGYFNVIEIYKGTAQGVPYIKASETPSSACSLRLEQEERYYVFTDKDEPVWYNLCSNTVHEMWHKQEDLQKLGDSK